MDNSIYMDNYCKEDLSDLRQIIHEKGYVVIPNVINTQDIELARKGLWETLETLTSNLEIPIKKEDSKSWLTFWELFPLNSMLLKQNVGHAQFVWDLRSKKKIKEIFTKLYEDDNLLVSFDGFSVHFPFESFKNKRGVYRGKERFHTDHSPDQTKNYFQGIVNLYDVNEGDATLKVIEKSNQHFSKFFEEKEIKKVNENFYQMDSNDKRLDELKKVRVMAKAGDFILWDSRTFHCGGLPLKNREKPNFRLAVYICMAPRKWATTKQLEKKKKAFNELRMTSHCPIKTKLNPLNPRTYGKSLPNIKMLANPVLDEETKKLAGF